MVFLWNIEERNEFFIVVCTWNRRFASVLYYYQKNPPLKRPLIKSRKKEKWIFYSSKHISSHLVATNVRKIRDQGSNFSNETRFCEAACVLYYYIKKSIFRPLQEKKVKHRLTFQLLFSKLLFSFFENNVFT